MALQVDWDSKVCIHSGNCVKKLPEVFRVEHGKFVIDPAAASQERRCRGMKTQNDIGIRPKVIGIAGLYLALAALSFFLTFCNLDGRPFWGDEAETALLARNATWPRPDVFAPVNFSEYS